MTFLEHTSKATVALGVGILHGVRGLVPRRIGTEELPSQPTNKFENPLSAPLPFRQSAVPFDRVADENPSWRDGKPSPIVDKQVGVFSNNRNFQEPGKNHLIFW